MSLAATSDFVGVRDLFYGRVSKRDFLLFDRISVMDLERGLGALLDDAAVADMEWLAGEGLLGTLESDDIRVYSSPNVRPLHEMMMLGSALTILGAVAGTDTGSAVAKTGISAVTQWTLRKAASYLEESELVRAVPIIPQDELHRGWMLSHDWPSIFREVSTLVHGLESVLPGYSEEDRAHVHRALGIIHRRAPRSGSPIMDGDPPSVARVLRVSMAALPEISEVTPLEALRDFSTDPATKKKRLAFRRWAAGMAETDRSPAEIAEELDELMHSYATHMKAAELRFTRSPLEILLFVPGSVGENLLKLKWSRLGESISAVRASTAALLEAEMSAPGREVALIAEAISAFPTGTAGDRT